MTGKRKKARVIGEIERYACAREGRYVGGGNHERHEVQAIQLARVSTSSAPVYQQKALAEYYGVAANTILEAVRRRAWYGLQQISPEAPQPGSQGAIESTRFGENHSGGLAQRHPGAIGEPASRSCTWCMAIPSERLNVETSDIKTIPFPISGSPARLLTPLLLSGSSKRPSGDSGNRSPRVTATAILAALRSCTVGGA